MTLDKARVGIFIMSHNRFQMTENCVKSVMRNTIIPHTIVFIDWKSTDGTREMVTNMANLLKMPLELDDSDLGYADCNTLYMKKYRDRFDYIFLLNNDCEVFPGWLEFSVAAFMNDPTIGHVATWVSRGDWYTTMSHGANLDSSCNTVIPMMNLNHSDKRLTTEGLYYAYAGFGLYRMDLCEALGYLEQAPGTSIYWDDTDYGMKVNSAGFKVQYIPQARIGHIMHIDSNRSHHVISMQKGREWFQSRWWDFVKLHDGYDPMKVKDLPSRRNFDPTIQAPFYPYAGLKTVRNIKGYEEAIKFRGVSYAVLE